MTEKRTYPTWTRICDLFPFKSEKAAGLNGRADIACPIIIGPGASIVISAIPEADRKTNGPTYRMNIVRDVDDAGAKVFGPVGGDDIPF